jgi:tRNA dimethylallyltransferase
MKKIIVVCGPTATGKSDYAVELAKKVNGEIISADSRQVYKGLDIGSGKITAEEMQNIPHHLLDVADPKEIFSVTQYQSLATKVIEEIITRGHTPIICGGTGLYIDAVVYGTTFPAVEPDEELRDSLEERSTEELAEKLKLLDPRRYTAIDTQNRVRLIRAIEIATELGSVPETTKELQYDVEWHYLDFDDEVVKKRIHDRLLKRMDTGMIEEVQRLHDEGVSWERLESLGLEYRYLALYLQHKLSKDDMLTQLEFAIWHYAKRQRTWLKKYAK